jgi:hypothetical protein
LNLAEPQQLVWFNVQIPFMFSGMKKKEIFCYGQYELDHNKCIWRRGGPILAYAYGYAPPPLHSRFLWRPSLGWRKEYDHLHEDRDMVPTLVVTCDLQCM